MTQRFNILDIVVGVGMCAIMFGAVVFFLAATGILEGRRLHRSSARRHLK